MYGFKKDNPANMYLFKVDNKNIKKRCEICSKLTIKTREQRQKLYSPWNNYLWFLR